MHSEKLGRWTAHHAFTTIQLYLATNQRRRTAVRKQPKNREQYLSRHMYNTDVLYIYTHIYNIYIYTCIWAHIHSEGIDKILKSVTTRKSQAVNITALRPEPRRMNPSLANQHRVKIIPVLIMINTLVSLPGWELEEKRKWTTNIAFKSHHI